MKLVTQDLFDTALQNVRSFYDASPDLKAFCDFPKSDQLTFEPCDPFHINPATLCGTDQSLYSSQYAKARDSLIAVKDIAKWRETYRDTNIGDAFLDNFGCYELFGLQGHYHCKITRGFVVYSAPDLYYPWHHHPAEEIYFIIAGEAEFAKEGSAPKMLKPGDTVFHKSNEPHNMQTRDKGVLAWVQWRGDLTTPPILTDRLNP